MSTTSERKIISINPELFNINNTRTRKKRSDTSSSDSNPIKVKSNSTSTKNESNKTIRNRILKYIREQQEQNLKKYIDTLPLDIDSVIQPTASASSNENINSDKTDFEESLDFMKSFSEKNRTIKNNDHEKVKDTINILSTISPEALTPVPEQIFQINPGETQEIVLKHATPNMQRPVYGCMKGGDLPTYRSWKNQTQKQHNEPYSIGSTNILHNNIENKSPISLENMTMTSIANANGVSIPANNTYTNGMNANILDTPYRDVNLSRQAMERTAMLKEMNKRTEEMEKARKNIIAMRPRKQKKITRRTYRVGKSKKYPRVSVLISNKTIRRNITSKAYEIKQIPIEDVKKTLIKKGLIKAGCIAPVDVLRKMYETVSLMCGDVENHNPDYLLHNYLHADL